MKRTKPISAPDCPDTPLIYNSDGLRVQARWIRDELDPQVARDGSDALHSDEILKLDDFLRRLLHSNITIDDVRSSRIHLAIAEIAGCATRWPRRLVGRCDALKEEWETKYGPLKQIGILLYEPGGRLHGICKPEDLSKERLLIQWLKAPNVKLSPMVARKAGDLGFKPGDWWINPMFAFRDSIIDSGEHEGGIVADENGAYAVLMTGAEEITSNTPESFTYRSLGSDRGRYRLVSGMPESRQPVRILRSHSVRSFWAPRAGVRYDGLYEVTGWSLKLDTKAKVTTYDIKFQRLASEPSMVSTVLCRPRADEVEDYKEYKRIRQVMKDRNLEATKARLEEAMPTFTMSVDGSTEIYEDETAQTPFQESFIDRVPEERHETKMPLAELPPKLRRDLKCE